MPIETVNPTANQTPDPTIGGDTVNVITNTGCANTVALGTGFTDLRSGQWRTFSSLVQSPINSLTLKVDYTYDGTYSGPSANNQFQLEFSVDNGDSWSNMFNTTHTQVSASGTVERNLSNSQNPALVRVRVRIMGTSGIEDDSGQMLARLSNIRIENNYGSVGGGRSGSSMTMM